MLTTGNKKQHFVKVWPTYFTSIQARTKTAEIRKDDRGYKVGDDLILMEWCPELEAFTGKSEIKRISHVQTDMGLRAGYVCLSLDGAA